MTDDKERAEGGTQAPAPQPAPKKKVAAKRAPKAETSVKKLLVQAKGQYPIACPAQNVVIRPNVAVEVEPSRWILRQIELGSIKEI